MRQVAESTDARVGLAPTRVDEGDLTAGTLDDETEVAGTAQGRRRTTGEQGNPQ